jgi:YbbR domain-containing protein
MPYQDEDEEATADLTRSPSRAEKVLRKLFVEDWSLKLLSLAITVALWIVVTGQNTPVNTHASVQLQFIRPSQFEISNDPPKTVEVLLSGSKHKLDALNQAALVATIDISDQRPGERVLRLAERAQLDLPQGVKIEAFQPSAIPIRLEPIIARQLAIETKLEGEPPPGYEIYSVRPSKSTVAIQGPASLVNALKNARTETISVTGHKDSFTAPNVAIDISDPKVDLLDPVVSITVEIGERRVERTFSDIPVTTAIPGARVQQRKAMLTMFGPASVINSLRPQDLRIVLDAVGDSVSPRLDLAPDLQGKVSIKSIKPEKFVVTN